MDKKTWLDLLFYEKGKQNYNFELCCLDKDKIKSKWKKYLDVQADKEFLEKVNNRTILPNEIVIDLEDPKLYPDILEKIKTDFQFYAAYETGSRGYHIHLFFDEELNSENKEIIIARYKGDLQKSSNRCMIALENFPHYKTGKTKNLTEENKGINKILFAEDVIKREIENKKIIDSIIKKRVPKDFFIKNKFIPKYLADEILINYMFKTDRKSESIFLYQDGVYNSGVAEAKIKEKVSEFLSEETKLNRGSEVIYCIKTNTYFDLEKQAADINLVNLRNGIYNLEEKKLASHSPDIFLIQQLPIKYDPEAKCENIIKFIKEIVNEADVPVLQEMFGYCLLRNYKFKKAFLFVGDGDNGKTTLINLLKAFVGQENTIGISLQRLGFDTFAAANLYGKLINIYDDLPANALSDTGQFKMLTGNSPITARFLFKNFFNFNNYAKLIYSCNKIPEAKDETSAFFGRWILINFPNVFSDELGNKDPDLILKITTEKELSGLFNWALEGLDRLLKNNKFSYSETTQKTRERYEKMSSPIKAFAMDCVDLNPEHTISKEDLFAGFSQYCINNNYPTMDKSVFGKKLPEAIPSIRTIRKRIDGRICRVWEGVELTGSNHVCESNLGSNRVSSLDIGQKQLIS